MVIRLAGVQLSEATAIPRVAGDLSDSQEMTLNAGQVNEGEVLSSTIIFCTQVAVLPHSSVAFQVLINVPVPIQPVIWLLLSV